MRMLAEGVVFGLVLFVLTSTLGHASSKYDATIQRIVDFQRKHQLPNDITFEVANTEKARSLGLAGRKSIPKNKGMLFVFPDTKIQCMWAKDMLFDLRVLYLDNEGSLISSDIMKAGSTEPHCSPVPVSLVAEVNL